jgi:hypothetical protein
VVVRLLLGGLLLGGQGGGGRGGGAAHVWQLAGGGVLELAGGGAGGGGGGGEREACFAAACTGGRRAAQPRTQRSNGRPSSWPLAPRQGAPPPAPLPPLPTCASDMLDCASPCPSPSTLCRFSEGSMTVARLAVCSE